MANSISHASLPYPIKNARFTLLVPYLDADGDPTDPTTPDTEVSQDGGAFADAAEEVTTITGSNGCGYVTLTGAETNNSAVAVAFKVASGPKATLATLYPRNLAILESGTASAGAAGTITLASGTYTGLSLIGCFIRTTGGTGGGGTGGANNQARRITGYNTGTRVATVTPNWETTPDNTTTYDVLLPEGVLIPMLTALAPTTLARTLDVSTGGEAGLDWNNVGTQGATVALTATTVATVTTATNLTNERGKYAMGAVWIGPTANTNTVSYTDGIITNPVSTIAAAKTVADALGMRRFEVIRTGTVQIGADLVGYRANGVGWSLTTTGGSRDVGTSAFIGASVVGGTFASTSGGINWDNCEFATGVTVGVSNMIRCYFQGTLTLSTAGNYDFIDCASVVAGTSTPVFAVPAGTVNISFRRWSGGISITGITSGTTISIDAVSGGSITLAGADGNVQVRGMVGNITDNRTGAPTLGTNNCMGARFDTVDSALTTIDDFLDTEIAAIKAKTDQLTFTTANQVDAQGISFAAGSITAAAIATDAIGSDELAAAAVTKIVTGVWAALTSAHTVVGSFGEALTHTHYDVETPIPASIAAVAAYIDTEVAAIKAKTDQLTFTTANQVDAQGLSFAAGSITAAAIATGAIDADALAADAVTEIWAKAMTELSAVPGVTGTVLEALSWVFTVSRNKLTQTSTTHIVKKDDGTTTLGTSTVSDDGTTYTRGEYA